MRQVFVEYFKQSGGEIMGAFIAKQPNGKYCRFSGIVDCPTHINMTREDYINMCMEKARKEAEDVLENYMKPFEWVEQGFCPNNMTYEEFAEVMRKMSDPNAEYEVL